MALLEVRDLTRSFYGVQALSGVDLAVEPHRITGLIGPNGAGKTTLFNCISGRGAARLAAASSSTATTSRAGGPTGSASVGLVRTFQIARGIPRLSVLENLLLYGAAPAGRALRHRAAASARHAARARPS